MPQARIRPDDKRVSVTDQDNDVSTLVAGADGMQTVWDLQPSTDIYYWLLQGDHPQLGSEGNLRFRMQLPREGGGSTEISDNATVRIVAQGPEQEDTTQLGRTFPYRRFSQANQFDEEDVTRLFLENDNKITEAAHLKVQVDNSDAGNDVDLSQTGGYLEVEMIRGTES